MAISSKPDRPKWTEKFLVLIAVANFFISDNFREFLEQVYKCRLIECTKPADQPAAPEKKRKGKTRNKRPAALTPRCAPSDLTNKAPSPPEPKSLVSVEPLPESALDFMCDGWVEDSMNDKPAPKAEEPEPQADPRTMAESIPGSTPP